MSDGPLWIQVPPPGELYSPANGSSIPTIVAELAQQHARRGGRTAIVVRDELPHESRDATLLRYRAVPVQVTRWQVRRDTFAARVGRPRKHVLAAMRPVIEAIPEDFDGPVLLHNAPGAVAALRRWRPAARPCLYLHNDLFKTLGRRERAQLVEQCALVICVSTFVADRLTRGIRVPDDRILVLTNGADPNHFFPSDRPSRRPGDPLTVLFVGRTVRDKAPHLLLHACRDLINDGHDVRLRIVGNAGLIDGGQLSPYDQRLRRSAAPIADRVEFVPFVDRLAIGATYRAADVFCVPSIWDDPCPLVLSEALASGLACVVSDRGGMPEQAGGAGWLVRANRVNDLRRALEALVTDTALRERRQRQAARRGAELTWWSRYQLLHARLAKCTRVRT